MKQLLLILSLTLTSFAMSAQSNLKFLKAFGESELTAVENLLADNIRLCIEDEVSEVNRTKAIAKLKEFIANHNIGKKKILHNGKSTDKDSSYKVARIKTESGTYRVFSYSEKEGDTYVIKEIRIDKI